MQDLLVNGVAGLGKRVKATLRRLQPKSHFYFLQPLSFSARLSRVFRDHPERSTAAATILAVAVMSLSVQSGGVISAPEGEQSVPQLQLPVPAHIETPAIVPGEERTTTAPSSRGQRPSVERGPLTFEENFIRTAANAAQESQKETGVPASVTIAQAILESDWGRSGLTVKAKNYFGIKARPDPGPAGVVFMNTWEVMGGANVTMNEPFRAYNDMKESFIDHGRFLRDRPFYKAAFQFTKDPKQFVREIHKGGYATDPNYSSKLISLMDKFNLYEFDLP